ncbi:MAG: type II toxin-antitoxin system RelE/ParE family toxin [Terracidiphilus sp.]
MDYTLHPQVYGDLEEIHAYFDGFNPTRADRILDEFLDAFNLLSRFPNIGHRRTDLTSRPLRFRVVRDYLIAYLPEFKPLWIVAVVDGRRNPRVLAALLRGRE